MEHDHGHQTHEEEWDRQLLNRHHLGVPDQTRSPQDGMAELAGQEQVRLDIREGVQSVVWGKGMLLLLDNNDN